MASTLRERIIEKLTNAFTPHVLTVTDVSARHIGHAGWREGGESHFEVRLIAGAFSGTSRLERHRMVHDALSGEIADLHALKLDVRVPKGAEGASTPNDR